MSALQKQLAAIAASSSHQLDLKAQKAAHGKSLLFDSKTAASQSFDTIYTICCHGYRELCALDSRFAQFAGTLFSEESKTQDRSQMSKKSNQKLDIILESFMTMVGSRLLLKPAEQALEWLIRRFRVHEYNTQCLVFTYLPYHTHPQFSALLSVLPKDPPHTLRFLSPYINSPQDPGRQKIVYTAISEPSFFSALQEYVVKVLDNGHQGSALLSFWTSVTVQALDGVLDQSSTGRRDLQDQRLEKVVLRTLPVLNSCMQATNGPEAITACYMIIIVMVTKAEFEDKVLDSLMEAAIISQRPEVLDACLRCLAVIAEERSQVKLPLKVRKMLLRIPNLAMLLVKLSKQCRVARLALACALGAIDRLSHSPERRITLLEIMEAGLLDYHQASVVLSSLLERLRSHALGSEDYGETLDIIAKLNESKHTSEALQHVAERHETDLQALGLSLELPGDENMDDADPDDEDMMDIDLHPGMSVNTVAILPPKITTASFLDGASSDTLNRTATAFEKAISLNRTKGFLRADALQQREALNGPLFLSFLICMWCSHRPISIRSNAIAAVTSLVKSMETRVDLQNLVPYLVCALSDSSPIVRRSAATCVAAISEKMTTSKSETKIGVWGSSLYDKNSTTITTLQLDQSNNLLSMLLVPILEECIMDSKFVVSSVRSALEGAEISKDSKKDLKASSRAQIFSYFASHAAATPLLKVRLCLLPLFNISGKTLTPIRTSILLPAIRDYCSLSNANLTTRCQEEDMNLKDIEKENMSSLMPREQESINILGEIISGKLNKDRPQLIHAAFSRIRSIWRTLKLDSRLAFSQKLLEISLNQEGKPCDELCREQSLETLRSVKLDTESLVSFLQSIPTATQLPEGPPAKKRKRTSHSESSRNETHMFENITQVVRKLTLVLELVEGSNPAQHPVLFKSLFGILAELPRLQEQSQSELVYVLTLLLGSLTPIVNTFKDTKETSHYQSSVRADLLIDIIRHSASPQAQNSALLLIASLASWVPDLILHNLMPIFTFIGSTLLRQQDDYSAHIVDQTISRVVPQLAISLRAKHQNLLTGVADLLLSFTAAFEHIPSHRRLKLFSELARTLGPQDSLPAIIALLVDRYPTSKTRRRFITELLLVFDPILTLETFNGYLDLVVDAAGPKHKVAGTLFSINDKQPVQLEATLHKLLSSLADMAADENIRNHVPKAFRGRRGPIVPRDTFARTAETTIQLRLKVAAQSRLSDDCNLVLGRCLDLLPTTELIKSAELLLDNADSNVQVAAIKSVEARAGYIIQNDQSSVTAVLKFLPRLETTLCSSDVVEVKANSVSCIERIVERFGKKDASAVSAVAQAVSGPQSLSNADDRVRILSLICLTTIVDILEDEAISLLPGVLPVAFTYLQTGIEQKKPGLHNAVYSLLQNIIERLGFMFSRDYMIPALKLSHRSAAAGLDDACLEHRMQFAQAVSRHLEASETFKAIKSTWSDAIAQGFEASQEQLKLMRSTIDAQTKSKLVKSSSTLFGLLIEVFDVRKSIDISAEPFEDDEVEQLEDMIIDAMVSMTLKLNDATFRPFFVQLVDFASSASASNRSRSITQFKFLAAFFERFKSIVTIYSGHIVEHASSLLEYLSKGNGEPELRHAVLNALQRTFQHDQDGFWQAPSRFGEIMPALLKQLAVDSAESVSSEVIPTITELAAVSSSSVDNHRDMNNVLLKYMRAEEAHTRLATVKCEQSLTSRLGEEWLGLLPEMLPFINELREDDDEMVERETQRWITMMEEILGEDLDAMLQ